MCIACLCLVLLTCIDVDKCKIRSESCMGKLVFENQVIRETVHCVGLSN